MQSIISVRFLLFNALRWSDPCSRDQVLKRHGIETQLVVYPGEFHGLKRPSFVRDRYNRYLDWYSKYVMAE